MIVRGCADGGDFHSCDPRSLGEIASYLYGKHLQNVGIGTGCFCEDNICNADPWENLMATKFGKVIERKITPETRPNHATDTDATPTHTTKTDAKSTDVTETDANKTDANKSNAKEINTTAIAIIIPENEPRREGNSPNNVSVLHTRRQPPNIPIIVIHFILLLIIQY